MRLLIATDYYPPFIGGAHRQSRLLALGMAARGHDVEVVTTWHKGFPAEEIDEGVPIHRVRQLRTAFPGLVRSPRQRHQPPFPDPLTVLALRRLIAARRPDIIHVYGWLSFSVAAAVVGTRIPLLVSARDYGYFCATRTLMRDGAPCSGPAPMKCLACAGRYYGGPKGWVAVTGVAASRPLLMRRMTALHSVSTYVRDVTRRHLSLPERDGPLQFTIPSFQDVAPDDVHGGDPAVAAVLEQLPDEPFILFVGAFRKIKGLEVLFDAYRRLAEPPPLVLIGTYERDAPPAFPPEAIVLKDVPHGAVLAAWDRALFGVMPSLLPEPLGAVVAEAMSRGKPVIGTRLGGHVDMLDARNGILVDQGDPVALAAAMSALIDDPERREALGRAGRERWTEFAAPAVLPRFEQAYQDVIASVSP